MPTIKPLGGQELLLLLVQFGLLLAVARTLGEVAKLHPGASEPRNPRFLEHSGPQAPLFRICLGPDPGGRRSPIAGGFSAWDTRFCRRTTRRHWRSGQRSAGFSAADTVFLADLLEAGRPVDQPCIQAVAKTVGRGQQP